MCVTLVAFVAFGFDVVVFSNEIKKQDLWQWSLIIKKTICWMRPSFPFMRDIVRSLKIMSSTVPPSDTIWFCLYEMFMSELMLLRHYFDIDQYTRRNISCTFKLCLGRVNTCTCTAPTSFIIMTFALAKESSHDRAELLIPSTKGARVTLVQAAVSCSRETARAQYKHTCELVPGAGLFTQRNREHCVACSR